MEILNKKTNKEQMLKGAVSEVNKSNAGINEEK